MKTKVILLGARGVGKTTLLRRWEKQSQEKRQWIDLDEVIAKKFGISIQEFFATKGEKAFRFEEQMALMPLLRSSDPMVIAVGAGFEWQHWNWPNQRQNVEVIWIARESDEAGRIFIDRPRLDTNLSPLQEYLDRYSDRLKIYRQVSDWQYLMPEGDFQTSQEELSILENENLGLGGIFTLHPHHESSVFFEKLQHWQFDFIEVRDDLWDFSQLIGLRKKLRATGQKILWAIRDGKNDITKLAEKDDLVDWGLEVSTTVPKGVSILSSHSLKPPVSTNHHLKWSPMVENWSQLIEGIQWQGENPAARSYLPRSNDGRWRWVRLWQKNRQQLSFVRDSFSSVLDQPTLHEWMRTLAAPKEFAAVIGHPVSLSWSPMEHMSFFRKRQMPFYSIPVLRNEVSEAMPILEGLGLRAVAVTAPLKEEIFHWTRDRSEICNELQSANTLVLKSQRWVASNTDVDGLEQVKRHHGLADEALIWGGGGTMSSLQKVFPKARFYSVRTGAERESGPMPPVSDELVIWAGGPDAKLPPSTWRPKIVLDLNYLESSLAREYASQVGAQYISGALMFHAQAQAQQEIWDKVL